MNNQNTNVQEAALQQTNKDFAYAVFAVSVMLNLTIFIAWLLIATDSNLHLLLIAQ